jgi:hypothetical protein
MEEKKLREYVNQKENIFMLDIICFEYLLLEFKDLISWIYAFDDEFLTKRVKAIKAREKLVSMIETDEVNYKDIKEIVDYNESVDSYNIEQLSAKILFDLTRNTGFEVSKGKIGDCWVKSCCEWQNRMNDDICGLDKGRLSVNEKMRRIYKGTCLEMQLQKVGLEVAV